MSSSRFSLTSRFGKRDVWLLAVITLAAAVLRLHMLAAKSLWIDEAASVSFATMPWVPFFKLLWAYQGNMTLYYVLLRFWIHLGDSEFAIRSLSVLLGIVSIPAIYVLGRRLFSRNAALLGSALLAVHSFHVHYSQEARAYSLVPLLLIVTAYFLARAVEAPQRRLFWASYAVAAALAVYAHIFAVLAVAGQVAWLVVRRPHNINWRTLVVTAALLLLLIAPMAAFVILQHSNQIDWVPPLTWADALQAGELLTGRGGVGLLLIYVVLCALAFTQPEETQSENKRSWLFLLLGWLLLPPAIIVAVSFIKPILVPRFVVMCIPALALLAGRGLENLYPLLGRARGAQVVALSLVLALSLWGTQRYFKSFPEEESHWRLAVAYICAHEQSGDGAIFYIPNAYAYDYYVRRTLERGGKPAPAVLYPLSHFHRLSHAEVERVSVNRARVWLILHMESNNPQMVQLVESALSENYRLADQQVFPGEDTITVLLYVRHAPFHSRRAKADSAAPRSPRL